MLRDLDYLGLAGGLLVLVAAGEAVRRILKAMHRLSVQADAFLGTPASGGVPARPGVLERVERLEDGLTQVAQLQSQVAQVQKDLTRHLAKETS